MEALIKNIPTNILNALNILINNKYQAFLVGGCVRDLFLNKTPNDWDITTNATPEQIQAVFQAKGFKAIYENQFGTVLVILSEEQEKATKSVEITPFRLENNYSDKRHPDEIKWAETLDQDLQRRDFTCNALAIRVQNLEVIDLFEGRKDIKNKIIKAVGEPEKRFKEDALRLIRAIRLAVCLNETPWQIEASTFSALKKQATDICFISQERIRDELIKIIQSPNPKTGIELLRETGLLKHILPELLEGYGVSQNKHHIFEVYQHLVLALEYAAKQNFSFEVKMAALLHDIGKPRTKKGQGKLATFYNHELVSANLAKKALTRLRFPKKQIEKISLLIKSHLFYYNVGEVKEASVRKLLRKVGKDNIEELLQLRQADRIGSGVPKAEPYKLRHLKYLFEKVAQDPISVKMLKVSGKDVMEILRIKPGPRVGHILTCLLSDVLSYPEKNKKNVLAKKIEWLGQMSDPDLGKLFLKSQKEINEVVQKNDQMTKAKYWVS